MKAAQLHALVKADEVPSLTQAGRGGSGETGIVGPLVLAALRNGRRFESRASVADRKSRGQFFTPSSIATFMAAQLGDLPRTVRLLDPGAGGGILTAAVCDRILSEALPRALHATLYENHTGTIPLLSETMEACREVLTDRGHTFTYTIREADFILDNEDVVRPQKSLFANSMEDRFDVVIMNPPYYKLNREDPRVKVMEPIVHGQPNIYALFMAMGAALLDDAGQLVAITPRSYCNGLYFREFRRWFLSRVQPRSIHVFGSRTEAFHEDDVLQENIILTCDRTDVRPKSVRITRSIGRTIDARAEATEIPYAQLVDNKHRQAVIRIPEHNGDEDIVRQVEHWQETFSSLGFHISTGPVVSFRARHVLCDTCVSTSGVAPLLWLHNVRPFVVTWPAAERGKAQGIEVSERTSKILVPAKNYVLIRRFSAKEERRRMTAGVLLGSSVSHDLLGIENHLNYVYRSDGELSDEEAFGLAGLLNSALIDRYFRTISGNTQVNATEVRTMPMPALERIVAIGRALSHRPPPQPAEVETIVLNELGIDGALAESLLESCQ